jgi:hypothetical protein
VFQPGWIGGNGGGVNPVYAPNPLAPNGGVAGCDVACLNYNQNTATGGTPITGLSPAVAPNLPQYADHQPYLMQWNLSISRQLPGDMALNVAYVGTRGLHLWGQADGNPCLPEAFVNGVPNWANTAGPGGTPASCPLGRQMPNLSYDTDINTNQHSWYDGLQTTLQKKLGHGLELQTAYTYSKSLDTTQGAIFVAGQIQTQDYNLNIDKGPSQFDTTHNLRVNALYHFHNISSDSFAAGFLKGWWMGNIITAQSGFAFSPSLGNNQSGSGQANSQNDRASLGSNFNASSVIVGTPNEWFNPAMYEIQPAGYLGDAGRDSLRGPRLVSWDFSLVKDTRLRFLGEAGNLEFRAEFFNFLNYPNFGLPNNIVALGSGTNTSAIPVTGPTIVNGVITNPGNEFPGAAEISNTSVDSRDIQFALKLIF